MSYVRRFDHVGIIVANLEEATAFFTGLGLDVEDRTFMEGEFLDTVIGIPHSRCEIVMLRAPEASTGLALSSFLPLTPEPGSSTALPTNLGIRTVAFEVTDLDGAIDRVASYGYRLIGGIGHDTHTRRTAYIRGPEGILVSLTERTS
jgi:catechol 2,3-dioxygenase-like lactoylglutathione lyase family enzyme